jgi:AcrR family transcriptional regulator
MEVGTADRKQREKESLRAAILDAARELFVQHGFESVTMRKIAEKIEYSPTAIYQHFADKETLIQELCALDFSTLAASFQRLVAVSDPIERLRQIGGQYLAFAKNNPNHYRWMFMTTHPPGHDALQRPHKGNPNRDSYSFLRWTLQEAIEQGRLREDLGDADVAAQLAWGAMHGIIALQIAMCDEDWIEWKPLEEQGGRMVDALIRGFTR